MKNIELAYLAGLIDGEGSIGLVRQRKSCKYRWPCISISSTCLEIVYAAQQIVGRGHICVHQDTRPNHNTAYSWRIMSRPAILLCEQLLPLLRVPEKKRRAGLLANEYSRCTPRNGQYTKQMIAKKEAFERNFMGS